MTFSVPSPFSRPLWLSLGKPHYGLGNICNFRHSCLSFWGGGPRSEAIQLPFVRTQVCHYHCFRQSPTPIIPPISGQETKHGLPESKICATLIEASYLTLPFCWMKLPKRDAKFEAQFPTFEGVQTVKCKPWTERVAEKGLSRGVSRAAWKRRI